MTPFEFHTNMHFAKIKDNPLPPEKHQWRGFCPFCKKKDHFFFNAASDWDCKSCQKKGNVYSFIQQLHSELCNNTNLELLAEARGISLETLRRNRVKFNPLNTTFVIPTTNSDGRINQLYKASPTPSGGYMLSNTPNIDTTLFNWEETAHQDVWLCEGLWDKMAAEDIVGDKPIAVYGFPGSSFKLTWCAAFAGKDVTIFTDNDQAGQKILGMIKTKFAEAPKKASSLKHIEWPKGLAKGYDVNDCLKANGTGAFTYLTNNVKEDSINRGSSKSIIVPDGTCTTFDNFTDACREVFHFTNDMEQLTHLLITAIYALKIEGEQIWLRIIGPPGSSKTTLATLVGVSDQALVESTFTGLFSGWKDDDPSDASMISKIEGKALIIKDADALLQQPNKEQIFSELRDYYDKSISVSYRNRLSYSYEDSRSAFIFNGTHALRGMDNSALGERFLDFELTVTSEDRDKMTDKMLERTMIEGETGVTPVNTLKSKIKNLIDNVILNYSGVAKLDKDCQGLIKEYSKLISYMRARVDRNRIGEINYRPYPEVPTRLTGQFMKLFQCAPVVLGKDKADDNTIALAKRVALDVMDKNSYRFKVAEFLAKCPWQSMYQITDFLQEKPSIVERTLDDMRQLNMLDIRRVKVTTTTASNVAALKPNIASQIKLVTE